MMPLEWKVEPQPASSSEVAYSIQLGALLHIIVRRDGEWGSFPLWRVVVEPDNGTNEPARDGYLSVEDGMRAAQAIAASLLRDASQDAARMTLVPPRAGQGRAVTLEVKATEK